MSILLEDTAEGERFEPPEDTAVTFTDKVNPYDLPYGPLRERALEPPEPTEYAQRHGVSTDPFFEGTGKSGLTPLEPPSPSTLDKMSTRERRRFRQHEVVQLGMLSGFTSWEMKESRCGLDYEPVKSPDLTEPIHPIFSKQYWAEGGAIPIGGEFAGVYEARNPVVWKQIVPCLRLATLLLQHSAKGAWFDALYNGTRYPVPLAEMTDDCPPESKFFQATNIFSRPPRFVLAMTDNPSRNPTAVLNSLIGKLRFAFASRNTEDTVRFIEGRKTKARLGEAYATTTAGMTKRKNGEKIPPDQDPNYKVAFVMTTMSRHSIAPLLHIDMTDSERLAQQMKIADTFTHEMMHAIEIFVRDRMGQHLASGEPFYENEAVSEIGFSWANSVFGGTFKPVRSSGGTGERPFFCLINCTWPTQEFYGDGKVQVGKSTRYRQPEKFGLGATHERWLVPVDYTERNLQSDFWQVQIKKMGSDPLRIPKILGKQFMKQNGWNDVTTIYGPDYDFWKENPKPEMPENPDEYARWTFNQNLRVRAAVLITALVKQNQDETQHDRDKELLRDWDAKKLLNPSLGRDTLTREQWGTWQRARARFEMREAEKQNAIEDENYKNLTPQEAAKRKMKAYEKALQTLDQAARERDSGNQTLAYDICDALYWTSTSRITHADIFALKGTLDKIDNDTEYYNESAIWHYRQLQIQKVPGDWQPKIEKAEALLEKQQEKYKETLRAELRLEQTQIDDAATKVKNDRPDYEIGGICDTLLGSRFVSIRAQAHLMLAELESTPDRYSHAQQAISRCIYLRKEAPSDGDWNWMIERAQTVQESFGRKRSASTRTYLSSCAKLTRDS